MSNGNGAQHVVLGGGSELLGDFTTDARVLFLTAVALVIGCLSAFLALALLRLISLSTNIFFFQRISLRSVEPVDAHVGLFVIVIPMVGALIVGLMARYGSERIRGHGIPEALEAILVNGSRVDPKVAVLKPLSAAIAIGSGGPFGAEGPIIMTGGSFGSLIAQRLHLSSSERKVLLVSGAAAGMSATFASPIAAILLAVELLLFEFKPRSLVPVACASIVAYVLRWYLINPAPLFPVPAHPDFIGPWAIGACAIVGLAAGALSCVLTSMVYRSEDFFLKLPLHWMWWPILGGLAIGIGGLFFPRALGVGYSTIGELLNGSLGLRVVIGILIVKSLIWSISLGSGTSGGVLAPLLMMGAALGAVFSHVLPNEGAGFWEMVGMAAMLGGTMRVPLTATVFSLELTHDMNMTVPLITGVIAAYCFTVLLMRRSILTEKISRRGLHLSREYATDPLETYFVKDMMQADVVTLSVTAAPAEISEAAAIDTQEVFPVVDGEGVLVGLKTRRELEGNGAVIESLLGIATERELPVAYAGEPLRIVAHRMAYTEQTRLPVVDAERHVVGLITLEHLLRARSHVHQQETLRQRYVAWLPSRANGNGSSPETGSNTKG